MPPASFLPTGGYLTALALSRDSKLFAAGVDIHGVHDWTTNSRDPVAIVGYEKVPDTDLATHLSYLSSPVATVKKWTSPVLIIHADDDRNVQFSQSTGLLLIVLLLMPVVTKHGS